MDAMTTVRHEFNFYHTVQDDMNIAHLNGTKVTAYANYNNPKIRLTHSPPVIFHCIAGPND